MSRINRANLNKTISYLKRNGIRKTWYAVLERLAERKHPPYTWIAPGEMEEMAQSRDWEERGFRVKFSIVVPAYRTKPEYLKDLLDSLNGQTYPQWEMILADATEDDSVEQVLREYLRGGEATRIRYIHLTANAGIAENTNQALPYASGDYIGLLDHDDILTKDALYEMAAAIQAGKSQGIRPQMLYSDEDKCNGDRTEYYEPNFKEDFNLELLLSNNYICHFLVMDRKLMQKLKFRGKYDGAQDYDLVLRAVLALKGQEETILHIPKVLYHWRCHRGSTAENPESKGYAYEAGRLALQDFADQAHWQAVALDTAHMGFYTLCYKGSPFASRADIGAIGGRVIRHGRVVSGRLVGEQEAAQRRLTMANVKGYPSTPRAAVPEKGPHSAGYPHIEQAQGGGFKAGEALYGNLSIHYSGYLHKAVLNQEAEAVDIRNIRVRPECREIFQRVTGVEYREVPGTDVFDASCLPKGCDIVKLSLELGKALREAGYRVVYWPVDRKHSLETKE